jgi:hypothetical protein
LAAAVTVPPQSLLRLFGEATTNPEGKVSVNEIPESGKLGFGLLMLKKTKTAPFSTTLLELKNLAIVGGTATLRLAVAVLPVPPLAEEIGPVVLVNCPEAAPVTVTKKAHEAPAWIVAPDSEMVLPPLVTTVPLHAPVVPLTTVRPAGKMSVNATPVSSTVLAAGLVMAKVRVVVAFSAMAVGLKDLAIEGGATTTILAEAVPPVPPSLDVTAPVVLFCVPAAIPVTFTENVHWLLGARVAPDKVTTLVAWVAVIAPPPHEPVWPLGVDITRPDGSVSLKPIPVRVAPAFGLVMVKLKEVVPFRGMLAVPNVLLMVGAVTVAATVMVAVDVLPVPPSVEVTVTLLFLMPELAP